MTPSNFVKFALEVYNVIISKEYAKEILDNNPDILSNFNKQKEILGKNPFHFHNSGHKAPLILK
jgi:hypothetical protein